MGDTDNLHDRPRVVIDTCVLLRAMYDRVFPERKFPDYNLSFNALALARREYVICFTEDTRDEAIYMLAHIKRGLDGGPLRHDARLQFVQRYIEPYAMMVQPVPTNVICRDKNDQMFLEAAAGAKAEYIISTDSDLLRLEHDGLCQIVLPEQFNREVGKRRGDKRREVKQAQKVATYG